MPRKVRSDSHSLAQPADQRPPQRARLVQLTAGRIGLWILLGNVLLTTALTVGTTLNILANRQLSAQHAASVMRNISESVSHQVAAELQAIDNALATIAFEQTQGPAGADRSLALRADLAFQKRLLPSVSALRVADAQGQVHEGLQAGDAPFSIADRLYFQRARDDPGMVVSEPIQSRANGEWVTILARRLASGADGAFQGIVYAVIPARHFAERFEAIAVGSGGAISLRSKELRLIARFSANEPFATTGLGTRHISEPLRRKLATDSEQGWVQAPTALDKVERMTAYRRVPKHGLLVLSGMSTDDYLAPWRAAAWLQGLLSALVCAAVALGSFLFLRAFHGIRQSRLDLKRLAREQSLMLENDVVGMVRLKGARAQWVNQAVERMFGYGPGELAGQHAATLFMDPDEQARIQDAASAAMRDGGRFRTQLKMRRKDGTPFWVDLAGTVLTEQESLWMLQDIDLIKQREEHAHGLAHRDALTGLPNRRALEASVDEAIQSARLRGQGFAVCLVDLDGFKPVNDSHGHGAGDTVLAEVARRLQAVVRAEDTVARIGGDEFALVMSNVRTQGDVAPLLERCLQAIRQPIALDGGATVGIGASIGAVFGTGGESGAELLHAADEAMYAVKREGKGSILVLDAAG